MGNETSGLGRCTVLTRKARYSFTATVQGPCATDTIEVGRNDPNIIIAEFVYIHQVHCYPAICDHEREGVGPESLTFWRLCAQFLA